MTLLQKIKDLKTDSLTYQKRIEICAECPSLLPLFKCKECGCFMKVKAKIDAAFCPLAKW